MLHPLLITPPVSLPTRRPGPFHTLHRTSPSSQLEMMSRRDSSEVGLRDRGRTRRRDRGTGRLRSSRSRSPRNKSPNPQFRRNSPESETNPLTACPICLSRKRHPIRKCRASNLWDGQHKARCSRAEDGRIVDGNGRTLCSNWNQTIGCSDKSTRHIHKCSGCGDSSHGAQECSLTEKAQTTDPARRRPVGN